MMTLVLAMVWHRRGQAVTLALLALLAVAAAVAAPAYLVAADRAVAAGQIATASTGELTLTVRATQDNQTREGPGDDFADLGGTLIALPGFTYYYSAETPTVGLEKTDRYPSRLVFRQDVCAHVRIVAGRCLFGEGDALLGEQTAKRYGLAPGDDVTLSAATMDTSGGTPRFTAAGRPKTLIVAGVYRAVRPAETYWGRQGYFVGGPEIGSGEPVFTTAMTLPATDRTTTSMAIDGIAAPGTLDIGRLDALRTELNQLDRAAADLDQTLQIETDIPRLLDRIDEGRAAARLLVPVLAVPLVLLACFSIHLTVGYGTQGRQSELAVVALRGARWWSRWWLATGESLIAVLAGALLGCLAGQLLTNAVTAVRFPGVGQTADWSSLRYAPVAALIALLAAVAAQRRQLTRQVAGLLRRTTAPAGRAPFGEAVLLVLALLAGGQLFLTHGSLTGIGLFAPAFVLLTLALLVSRALLPLLGRAAARALHRGRLGPALAGLQLTRRPGAARLFALLVAAAAVAGYAGCAVDTAVRGRDTQARLSAGAERVLTVEPVSGRQLLAAVRAADPERRWAMAAAQISSGGEHPVPGLAVDTERLARVAIWPAGAPSVTAVANRLRPERVTPTEVAGPALAADVTSSVGRLRLTVTVSSVAGEAVADLGELRQGRSTYRTQPDVCRAGCRINSLEISATGRDRVAGRLVLRGLGNQWLVSERGKLSEAPEGITLDVDLAPEYAETVRLRPAGVPDPLPVAYAGEAPVAITGLADEPVPVAGVVALPAVPSLGRDAFLVDLGYVGLLGSGTGSVPRAQVWLSAAAPADAVERLTAEGLTFADDTGAAAIRARLDRQGPALSLGFYLLAAGLATLLGVGALVLTVTVDRGRRTEDLVALRAQGLRRGPAGQATFWTYPVLVTAAVVTGVLVALVGWWVTGWALPLAGVHPPDLPLPGSPRAGVLLWWTAAILLPYLLAAVLGGRDLRRRIG
ncbi:FtsX-like permease family protein [Actinoplanes regularis]|uniref:FtsX-like permease family protein n=1 Tax=Actinoplanes regularis TaxID=52697 RepID=A0A239D9S8_9ACTN|nr:FtsX-like permease family protein [Actinoplanes regularis]SNS29027.1 FtsX-like permease family protein [Actinoplanes regularis]